MRARHAGGYNEEDEDPHAYVGRSDLDAFEDAEELELDAAGADGERKNINPKSMNAFELICMCARHPKPPATRRRSRRRLRGQPPPPPPQPAAPRRKDSVIPPPAPVPLPPPCRAAALLCPATGPATAGAAAST